MSQENSVLFALRDLRSLEASRVAEEKARERALRLEEQRRSREEEARRVADQARAAELAAEQQHGQEERVALTRELCASAERNLQLEADVRQLRALMPSIAPPAPRPARWPLVAALALVGITAGFGIALFLRAPAIHERVVYVRTPASPVETAPVVEPPPALASTPVITRRVLERPKRKKPLAPVQAPRVECGSDPLCGTPL
jgi:hypothetical protein